jgi:hypothetical protein
MTDHFDRLPDELMLHLFDYLHSLHELRTVLFTSKRLSLVARDVPARTIARLALISGDECPDRKLSRVSLLAVRLTTWIGSDFRRYLQLQEAMCDNMDLILHIAMMKASTSTRDAFAGELEALRTSS